MRACKIPESSPSWSSAAGHETTRPGSSSGVGRKSTRLSTARDDTSNTGQEQKIKGSSQQQQHHATMKVASAGATASSSMSSLVTNTPVPTPAVSGVSTEAIAKMSKIFSCRPLPLSDTSIESPIVSNQPNTTSLVKTNSPSDIPKYGVDVPDSDDLDEVTYLFFSFYYSLYVNQYNLFR